jgi:hypothetical protein
VAACMCSSVHVDGLKTRKVHVECHAVRAANYPAHCISADSSVMLLLLLLHACAQLASSCTAWAVGWLHIFRERSVARATLTRCDEHKRIADKTLMRHASWK